MSTLTLRNPTRQAAQFVVHRGDLVVARVLALAPGSEAEVPDDGVYAVQAEAVLDGITYRSAPIRVDLATTSAAKFVAQVSLEPGLGMPMFQMLSTEAPGPDRLEFQKTASAPVNFHILRNGSPLQTVVVLDMSPKTLAVGADRHIYAVIGGVTSDTVSTGPGDATVTVTQDEQQVEPGSFTLTVA